MSMKKSNYFQKKKPRDKGDILNPVIFLESIDGSG